MWNIEITYDRSLLSVTKKIAIYWALWNTEVTYNQGRIYVQSRGSSEPPSSKYYTIYVTSNSGFMSILIKMNPLNTKEKNDRMDKGFKFRREWLSLILTRCIVFQLFFIALKRLRSFGPRFTNKWKGLIGSMWSFILFNFHYFLFFNLSLF